MVAIIKTGYSIRRIVYYNENKIKEGVAECIGAGNYPIDTEKMTFDMKLNRLLNQARLNENVKRNSVHISLNFDLSDVNLSKERLMAIAETYMEKIGVANQPYLVYQHYDAGHPHIHIVSVKLREDGSRVDTQNIGRNQSETARKEIEKSFGLVVAEERKRERAFALKPVDVAKVQYGRTETKRAITNVLDTVLQNYNYTSLPELNAVLNQYNITADRGSENSRVYINKGLVYRILDESGNKAGVPIKASDFYNKPTLKYLEERFIQNEAIRMPHKARLKNAIDLALFGEKSLPIAELIKALRRDGIHTVIRQNEDGLIYGITYVDHRTKCVFNGSALGKQYSAKAILERCQVKAVPEQNLLVHSAQKQIGLQPQATARVAETKTHHNELQTATNQSATGNVLDALMQPDQVSDYLPHQLKSNRRKKKRKHLNNNK